MATVYVPTPLRRLTGGQARVDVEAGTVGELIEKLEDQFPGIKNRLVEAESGEIKRFINVFVNGEEIRSLQGTETPLDEHAEVSIIPAMAGGLYR
ncbi:MAG: ubiquitin-like small modifier protein 1 [Ardenticatenia bacterium]|nr:ubiquitin-like small modifier protein 1 [Ardenticatenia bacterium]